MSERGNRHDHGERNERVAREMRHAAYEPPCLTELGTFYELTQQQLKISGTPDLVNFQPAPSK
jgi:hypothetical protein